MSSYKLAKEENIIHILETVNDKENYYGEESGDEKDFRAHVYYKTQNYVVIVIIDNESGLLYKFKIYVNVEDEDKIRKFIGEMVKSYNEKYGV